ncbi:MAG: ParB/RepB/Spo0J family partition protein [Clostridia bacterium]|nr:ParB/RepB/Spo0J family partition protein [Clostridia bacterium]
MGRGLGALFDDVSEDIIPEKYQKEEKSGVKTLKLRDVEPNPLQPRKNFEKDKLEALASSIREHGIIQPIVVKPQKNGMYLIVAGERRWRAAKLAGLSEVPCVEGDYTEKQVMELALIENLQREDLNAIEEAEGYKRLMNAFGLTQEEVATRVGKSRSAVANSLRMNGLSKKLKEMVVSGEISGGHARALLALEKESQRLLAAEKIVKEALSVRQTEKLVALLGQEKKTTQLTKTDKNIEKYFKDLAREISSRLGAKVTIKNGKNNGKIEIEYVGNAELEGILEKIKK